ncbi:hypothetical protein [Marinomonas gallaica]|uniref:hypothetical protein n=1 Tax=Marinomonas gallaica TaxID=1806667 RepID=UPI0008333CA2|nr:hypothetical protein [Marinomonas gallaica]
MIISILDRKDEGSARCYLVKVNLNDYLEELPEDYQEWDIQRGIVTNKYLDSILDTVIRKKHIPPMVLVVDESLESDEDFIKIKEYRILDGLQRTYRLKTIHNSNRLINELYEKGSINDSSSISLTRKFKDRIAETKSSATIVRKLIDHYKGKQVLSNKELFSSSQWFEVWFDLDKNEQIRKMLLLNAGHKSVSNKHQIEIIFHNYLQEVVNELDSKFKVLKERDKSSVASSKNRNVGEFHFSNIITTMLSLIYAKPVTVNADFLSGFQESDDGYYELGFNEIKELCSLLLEIDLSLHEFYGNKSTQWFGREVVLNGMFGAIGKYSEINKISFLDALKKSKEKIVRAPGALNIANFDEGRKLLSLSKVNVGQVTKKAVFQGVLSVLEGKTLEINWSNLFGGLDDK